MGSPLSVACIISIDIGIFPSNGTSNLLLSFNPPPDLNKLIGIEKLPSSFILIFSSIHLISKVTSLFFWFNPSKTPFICKLDIFSITPIIGVCTFLNMSAPFCTSAKAIS